MLDEEIITSPLPGFLELSPLKQVKFDEIKDIIRRNYANFGFVHIETPILERSQVLLAKAGGETEKQIYRFQKGDTDLAMRFDLTVPLARYVANNYASLVFPFKRYAIGKVYRGEKKQAGRFREFYQCDIDVIGDETLDIYFDAEIPCVMYTIFQELNLGKFTIKINNRKILNGFFQDLGLGQQSGRVMQIIDKWDKVGLEVVKEELMDLGLSLEHRERVCDFVQLAGDCEWVLQNLSTMSIANQEFLTGVAELREVVSILQKFGVQQDYFAIDLKIARGLDYYTGTVYETIFDQHPDIGSVCSGGRYENLTGCYINKKLPGVGMSIGLTRFFDQMSRKGVLQFENITTTKVLVVPMEVSLGSAMDLANTLRGCNIATEISWDVEGKLKKRLNYANKKNISFVIFLGEQELRQGVYTIKNLVNGEQFTLSLEQLLQFLQTNH